MSLLLAEAGCQPTTTTPLPAASDTSAETASSAMAWEEAATRAVALVDEALAAAEHNADTPKAARVALADWLDATRTRRSHVLEEARRAATGASAAARTRVQHLVHERVAELRLADRMLALAPLLREEPAILDDLTALLDP